MDMLLVTDTLRFSHLFAVCLGLGASIMADLYILNRLRTPLTHEMMATLHRTHGFVWAALGVMWVTGLGLLYLRTGFDLAAFTPKLMAKLGIVGLLTLNAILIGAVAMPILSGRIGRSIAAFPTALKLRFSLIGGISAASWLLALALGVSKALARSGSEVFAVLLPIAYVSALVATALVLLSRPMTGNHPV